jgi:transposase
MTGPKKTKGGGWTHFSLCGIVGGVDATQTTPIAEHDIELLEAAPLTEAAQPCSARCVTLNILRNEVGYWRAMHRLAKLREETLRQEIEELKAKLRLRERQLFGRKSERNTKGKPESGRPIDKGQKRKRGQQAGTEGHGRRLHEGLEAKDVDCTLEVDEQRCPHCGLPFVELEGTEDSEEVVVEVKAHRRVIRRHRYRPTCKCPGNQGIITAPGPAKLIPKGSLHLSTWVTLLLDKYLYQRPTYRFLSELRQTLNVDIAQGTVIGGLKRLSPLFEPLYEKLIEQNVSEWLWHADETRWLVFEEVEGKQGYKWYLWVFRSERTVVYVLDPTRSAAVPDKHFGEDAAGVIVVDRYSAYKAMVLVKKGQLLLAFCWAHVRRDFLSVAKDWPELHEAWGVSWVEKIANLYHLNKQRLSVLHEPEAFAQADAQLREAVCQMAQERRLELGDPTLHQARRKALDSMEEHWSGLTLFVEEPAIPMDNNEAERCGRNPILGRKGYHGSVTQWSGRLAVMLFSLFQTLLLWNINPRLWLTDYLSCCAENGCRPPDNAEAFLPWNLSAAQLEHYQIPTTTTTRQENNTS